MRVCHLYVVGCHGHVCAPLITKQWLDGERKVRMVMQIKTDYRGRPMRGQRKREEEEEMVEIRAAM